MVGQGKVRDDGRPRRKDHGAIRANPRVAFVLSILARPGQRSYSPGMRLTQSQRRVWQALAHTESVLARTAAMFTALHTISGVLMTQSRQDLEQAIAELRQAVADDQAADQATVDQLGDTIQKLEDQVAAAGTPEDFADVIGELKAIQGSIVTAAPKAAATPPAGDTGSTADATGSGSEQP